MVGPSIEAGFFRDKFGVELDAIYRRFGDSYGGEYGPPPPEYSEPPPLSRSYVRSRTNSWEVPLLGKYYFRAREANWRPFLGTGNVIRLQRRETTSTTYYLGDNTAHNSRNSASTGPDIGAVAVAGVELRGLWRLSFQPQARYTRWGNYSSFGRPLNQVDIGLGYDFSARPQNI